MVGEFSSLIQRGGLLISRTPWKIKLIGRETYKQALIAVLYRDRKARSLLVVWRIKKKKKKEKKMGWGRKIWKARVWGKTRVPITLVCIEEEGGGWCGTRSENYGHHRSIAAKRNQRSFCTDCINGCVPFLSFPFLSFPSRLRSAAFRGRSNTVRFYCAEKKRKTSVARRSSLNQSF